jgi:alkanesulfonate monooxygenase SsuD/methylene tetrahydromethanopterin reductase-like flavin-dependent oxidoreductase (luciferase family)
VPILEGHRRPGVRRGDLPQTLADHGHDPAAARVAMLVPWHLAETRAEADQAADSVLWYIRRQVNLVAPPDYTDSRHATSRVLGQLAAGMSPERSMDALREHLMVVLDDVEGSRQAVQRIAEAGATDLLCQFQVGGLDHERVTRAMRLFAEKVAPL